MITRAPPTAPVARAGRCNGEPGEQVKNLRGSGAEIFVRVYEVFELRDGAILRWEEFTDRGPALEAAGLSE